MGKMRPIDTIASSFLLVESSYEDWSVGFGIATSSTSGISIETPGVSGTIDHTVEATIEGTYSEHHASSMSLLYERTPRLDLNYPWNVGFYTFNENAFLYTTIYDNQDKVNYLSSNLIGDFYMTRHIVEFAYSSTEAYNTYAWMNSLFTDIITAQELMAKD